MGGNFHEHNLCMVRLYLTINYNNKKNYIAAVENYKINSKHALRVYFSVSS